MTSESSNSTKVRGIYSLIQMEFLKLSKLVYGIRHRADERLAVYIIQHMTSTEIIL